MNKNLIIMIAICATLCTFVLMILSIDNCIKKQQRDKIKKKIEEQYKGIDYYEKKESIRIVKK